MMSRRQQRLEYEARTKVRRMKRDMDLHRLMTRNEEFITKGLRNEEEEEDIMKNYRKTLVKIVSEPSKSEKELYLEEISKNEKDEEFSLNKVYADGDLEPQDFERRVSRVLDAYYRDIYTKDSLGNLTDEQIYQRVKSSPNRAKRAAAGLLKQLRKHGIKLGEDGVVDYSACENENIKKRFQKNPFIRTVLLEESLDFGSEVSLKQQRLAYELRKELEEVEYVREKEQTKRALEEERLKDPLNPFEKEIGFRYEAHQSTQGEEVTENSKKARSTDDDSEDFSVDHLKEFEKGNYQLESMHKLIEPTELRELRLERIWMENRMRNLDTKNAMGLTETVEERANALKELVAKIRRLKIQVDQVVRREAGTKLFEEHDVLTEEELQAESIPFELLQTYFRIPKDIQKLTKKDESEYARVKELIEEKELVEELVSPIDNSSINARLEFHSSQEEVERKRNNKTRAFSVPELEVEKSSQNDNKERLLDIMQDFYTRHGLQNPQKSFKKTAEVVEKK